MLRTALKPRWIAALLLAFAISALFVWLSQWQLSRSKEAPPPQPSSTEQVKPLTETFEPGRPLGSDAADQMVSVNGQFDPLRQVLIQDRIREGESGYWVVTALRVDGVAPATVIPVARGWISGPSQADTVPSGPVRVTGRLLPSEAPRAARPVDGELPSLSTAELINRWDTPSYAAYIAATDIKFSDAPQPGAAALKPLEIGPQPQQERINWLNIFYAVEWIAFAGFSVFLWWRLVADDYRRRREAEDDADEANEVDSHSPDQRHQTSEATP